jgi:hypothetical protein
MSFYPDMAKVARGLLAKFGAPVTFSREVPGEYDPSSQSFSSSSTLSFRGQGVVSELSREQRDGSDVRVGDVSLLLEKMRQLPTPGDLAVVGTKKYSVVKVTPLQPAGELVYSVAVLRAGPG